ncbi:unnamed protein product [Pleuronectes platessa]|uniref:Uncharacterized protein n=1 Tax=Pleuronectes platessa TaxID=8262 RepID=A0A9N7YYS4_PLEPL|nr:unnamed protein product [Pleuronectes platessa]
MERSAVSSRAGRGDEEEEEEELHGHRPSLRAGPRCTTVGLKVSVNPVQAELSRTELSRVEPGSDHRVEVLELGRREKPGQRAPRSDASLSFTPLSLSIVLLNWNSPSFPHTFITPSFLRKIILRRRGKLHPEAQRIRGEARERVMDEGRRSREREKEVKERKQEDLG